MLQFTLEAHGVAFRSSDVSVSLDGSDLTLEPRVFERRAGDGGYLVQLDILAYSEILGSRFINESIAGFGDSLEEAEKNAFGKFLIGPFHVLLTALANHNCDNNPAEWAKWGQVESQWSVCEGPAVTHGSDSGRDALKLFYPELEKLLISTQSREVHWIRTFVSSFSGKLQAVEVLLDNEPWPDAIELVGRFDWKPDQAYGSIRHFLIAIPK
jgi:hypothetical protein